MKFEKRHFSRRHAPLDCALFVVHEPCDATLRDKYGMDLPSHLMYRGTAAALILPDGDYWIGVTLCSPGDQFVKKSGRDKAVGRAYRSALRDHIDPFRMPLDTKDYSELMTRILREAIRQMKKDKCVYPYAEEL